MKFVHLSDLHIGKSVNKHPMIEEQKYILEQILGIIDREHCDSVLISGDIYDRSLPPTEAVVVFDDFLTSLVKRKLTIYIIAGNHDSADRLSFGAKLFRENNIHLVTKPSESVECVRAEDEYGEVNVYLLPYMTRYDAQALFSKDKEVKFADENSAMKAVLDNTEIETEKRNIILAHTFVTGAQPCQSEEGNEGLSETDPISVGTIDSVSSTLFEKFDYTALGHLHRPQKSGSEFIRYSGSPLKYSISEIRGAKSVPVVELKEKGNTDVQLCSLIPLHDMREIRDTFEQVAAADSYPEICDDFLHIILTDEEYVRPDAPTVLAAKFSRILRVDTDRTGGGTVEEENLVDIEKKSAFEIFSTLFEQQNGRKMTDDQQNLVSQLLEEIDREGI